MSEYRTTTMDRRVPLDKNKILEQFAALPRTMQIALLAGLTAGMAAMPDPPKQST